MPGGKECWNFRSIVTYACWLQRCCLQACLLQQQAAALLWSCRILWPLYPPVQGYRCQVLEGTCTGAQHVWRSAATLQDICRHSTRHPCQYRNKGRGCPSMFDTNMNFICICHTRSPAVQYPACQLLPAVLPVRPYCGLNFVGVSQQWAFTAHQPS
jgi:hypothetical protein